MKSKIKEAYRKALKYAPEDKEIMLAYVEFLNEYVGGKVRA